MIEITLKFDGYQEAAAVLLALGADAAAGKPAKLVATADKPAASAGKSVKAEKPAASPPPATQASEPAKTQPDASVGKATAATSPASTSLREKQYPETGIPDLINKYAGANKENREVAKKVLFALGKATKGIELKPEHFDAAHRAFTLLNDGTAADVVLAGLGGGEEDGGLG